MINFFINTNAFDHDASLPGINVFKDLGEFISSVGPKVAIIHNPAPGPFDSNSTSMILTITYDLCEYVIIIVPELSDESLAFIKHHDESKIIYLINGHLNFKLNLAKIDCWVYWFESTTAIYKNNMTPLARLSPFSKKSKSFDILLGEGREHRHIIYDLINTGNIKDNVMLTYKAASPNMIKGEDSAGWIWESDGLEFIYDDVQWSVCQVKYYDQLMHLSQIIPIRIYNQTAYSVVAETMCDNLYSFYTEKIVKPILARRLFIVYSGQYYLHNLRELGFKTFDGIIDESYDLEPDVEIRGRMIYKQIQFLDQHPQEQILEQIKPIVEHNYNLMMNTNWELSLFKKFTTLFLVLAFPK